MHRACRIGRLDALDAAGPARSSLCARLCHRGLARRI